jgi:hypothetical protein
MVWKGPCAMKSVIGCESDDALLATRENLSMMRYFLKYAFSGKLLLVFGVLILSTSVRAESFPAPESLPVLKELPDPLVMMDGTRISTAAEWTNKRKPELKQLFEHYVYGYFPETSPVSSRVVSEHRDALGGKATLKQISLQLGEKECLMVSLLLVIPNKKDISPPPLMLGLNFTGNHTVLNDPRIVIPQCWAHDKPGTEDHRATEAGRGTAASEWEIEYAIDRGYAVATIYYCEISPDKPGLNEGIHACIPTTGPGESHATSWGSVAAWAWGLQRAVDYLTTDADVDGKRIVVFGHSRNGKAALLAGAFDDRIAATIAHQAGCVGSAPSRRKNQAAESVTRINTVFPFWFNGNFKKFNGHEDQLPLDQHCLVALCAPRPVLFTCGEQDQWADPPGELDIMRAANSVYQLLGTQGIPQDSRVELDKRIGEQLCYYTCTSPHVVDKAYWKVFFDFADDRLPKPPK